MTATCEPSTRRDLDDSGLAAETATLAGRLLTSLRDGGLLVGEALGVAGDALSQVAIQQILRAHRPHDAILSEEAAANASRLDAGRVWIVDPLDGTREYAEGRMDWTVHVALALDGAPGPAAVALPGVGVIVRTDRPPDLEGAAHDPLRIAVSRTRAPPLAGAVAGLLGARLVPMGSAGAKAIAVLSGEADAYLHAGGQFEWDSCAPVAVALAAGLHASRIDGSPCRYNRPDPAMDDLLICRPELADALLEAIAAVRRSG